jgi:hypothetical protein
MPTDTQSVLDSMTAAIISRKKGAAAGLTPVGFEAPRAAGFATGGTSNATGANVTSLAGRHETMFPYDDPQTVHNAIAHGLQLVEQVKAELGHVANGLLALGALYAAPDPLAAGPPPEDPVKATEREADAKFAADMKEKQAAAQSQVFKWQCPVHGPLVAEAVSRAGRRYMKCVKCAEFEKEVRS